MNQPDASYWLSLAAQWINSKSQTQMVNFPSYPSYHQYPIPHQIIPTAPEPPRISHDATVNDNLLEADMDIEEEEPIQVWSQPNNISQTPMHTPQENIQQQQFQTIYKLAPKAHDSPKLQAIHKHQSSKNDKFVAFPSAPIIGQIDTSQAQDMILGSDDGSDDDGSSSAIMEAQKRKKLPVWIREGLERIEREKKLEVLRVQREKELREDEINRKKIMEEALKELEREKIAKSKYESESENDDELQRNYTPETEQKTSPKQAILDIQDDEENYEKMMLLVRKTLTEILLEATDEKIQEISSETLSKFRKKASSVTSNRTSGLIGLGLGVYSSSDDDSDVDEKEKNDDQSDWEPEHVLKERIRIKSIAYEHKAKEIRERLAKIAEAEQERFSRKKEADFREHTKHDSENDRLQKLKSRKNDGEEKFEQIYSNSFVARHRDKKKTRFNDPKDRTSNILLTHVGMLETSKLPADNGSSSTMATQLPSIETVPSRSKKERSKKRDTSSSSTSSSNSSHHKKHKKHKKSKHSKKSSKKSDRSRSRSHVNDKDKRKSFKSDRHSIESKSSIRSSESRRHRSRSRSRSHDRHHRSRRY